MSSSLVGSEMCIRDSPKSIALEMHRRQVPVPYRRRTKFLDALGLQRHAWHVELHPAPIADPLVIHEGMPLGVALQQRMRMVWVGGGFSGQRLICFKAV
eukprot:6040744-Alexandrium_andersonii.AAC.1